MWLLRLQILTKCPARPDVLKSRRQRGDKYGVWEGAGARDLRVGNCDLRLRTRGGGPRKWYNRQRGE